MEAPQRVRRRDMAGRLALLAADTVAVVAAYCTNWSLWLDAKILVRTIPYVLSRNSPEHRIRAER